MPQRTLFQNQTWQSARNAAQGLGAAWDLATITSAQEQAFISSLLGAPPTSGIVEYWVGGFQPAGSTEPGGNWQWINGEVISRWTTATAGAGTTTIPSSAA